MESNSEVFRKQAKRTYELGRLRTALRRAMVLTVLVGAASMGLGIQLTPWLVLSLTVWTLLFWRGLSLLRGGKFGLVAGAITMILPMSLLRPCCRPGMAPMSNCCTMPEVCVLVGLGLGVTLACFLPRGSNRERTETALGMGLGMTSLAALKCSALFFGEALGLSGGLLLGITVVSAAGVLLHRRSASVG